MTELIRRLVKEKPLSIIAGVVILLLILVAIMRRHEAPERDAWPPSAQVARLQAK